MPEPNAIGPVGLIRYRGAVNREIPLCVLPIEIQGHDGLHAKDYCAGA